MLNQSKKWILGGTALLAVPALLMTYSQRAQSSDHGDTTNAVQRPGIDLTDLYIFPSPGNANNVVLVMNVNGLIPPGGASSVSFDPDVLYQFKIDTNGDNVEDRVIQAKFGAAGAGQTVQISGPVAPSRTGVEAIQEAPLATSGVIGTPFSPGANIQVFAGPRTDPFFFDLEQLCVILPDRCQPFKSALPNPNIPAPANPNQAMATSWRPPGQAQDFLRNLNVLSIVVELPRSQLQTGTTPIGVWMTTST